MKITFQPTETPERGSQNIGKSSEAGAGRSSRNYEVSFRPGQDRNWIAGTKPVKEKGKTMAQLQQEAEYVDVGIQQDYRTVMSNTMSAEDYAKLEEEGFHFASLDPETAVTIVDKIKAELARSGEYIVGYTDDLDMDTLAAAVGSRTLAAAITDSFQAADIPVTQENIDDVARAWGMASRLSTPSEGTYRYMVDNGMEPEIWDYYLSQSSGAEPANGDKAGEGIGQPRFYAEDVQGYYAESAKDAWNEGMLEEIDKFLIREGLAVSEENRQAAENLLEQRLPLTVENLTRLQELKSVDFPVTEEVFARAAASAIAEGKDPVHGNLARTDNIYGRAVAWQEYFQRDAEGRFDLEDITARRQLEEIRLRMSAEVNVKLLQSGFAIDTAPMEELLEALRQAEAEVAQSYFPGEADAVSRYEIYQSTNAIIGELPQMPAQALGGFRAQETLPEFYEDGRALQEALTPQETADSQEARVHEKARAGYEALMTAPRSDLGDSIRKAFRNVDAILEDMGLEKSWENQRAVRILGYNRMEVNEENIERVKAADAQVQSVITKMTPAAVLKMIRDGVNPLEQSFEQLEQYFDSLPAEYENTVESYSRFLYGLEQKKEITSQERESYIGIYRMLHQIGSADGAAVGALVNSRAEFHFSNLLSAVRSGKCKTVDVSVTESFGATVELIRKGESISDQIAKGFVKQTGEILTELSYSGEADKTYRQLELEQIRQAASAEAECAAMLQRSGLPCNAGNLLASQALMDTGANLFREWREKKTRMSDIVTGREQEPEQMMEPEQLLDRLGSKEDFQDTYREMLETMDREVQEMSLQQADTSLDVRSLQLFHKQLSVAAGLAQSEEYIFPMYIGKELTKVHLTLDRNGEEKGSVRIAVDWTREEHLEGHFRAENGKISGFLVGNTQKAVTKLQKVADIFSNSARSETEGDWEIGEIPVIERAKASAPGHAVPSVNREVPDGKENREEINNTELYRIAKAFLQAVKDE